jgi:hypothetical protein
VIQRRSRKYNLFHCTLPEKSASSGLGIPIWMFDATRCAACRKGDLPMVSVEALRDLRLLLRETRPEAARTMRQSNSSSSEGETDAKEKGVEGEAAGKTVRITDSSSDMVGLSGAGTGGIGPAADGVAGPARRAEASGRDRP